MNKLFDLIPEAALGLHTGIVGKTRSGKTNTAKFIVEQLVAMGKRVCVLDPIKSDWWGITSSGDGKKPGLPFQILGGPHGHVPIHGSAGAAVGELVATGKLPLSIIDMADLNGQAFGDFYIAFAEALFKKMRGVLYLVVEEAHEFAPKERDGQAGENMRISWSKKIATAGGSKGIRLIACTQSVQQLHNRVFGSLETLISHRLTAPADITPVMGWFKQNASKEQAAEIMAAIPKQKTGEAKVYSTSLEQSLSVHFPKCSTYDNSATPTDDSKGHEGVRTAAVDLDGLRSLLGEAVAQAKENDPAELKKEIAELKRKLAAVPVPRVAPAVDPVAAKKQAEYVRGLEQRAFACAKLADDRGTAFDQLIESFDRFRKLPVWQDKKLADHTKTPQPLATGSRSPVESYRGPTLPAVNGSTTTVRAGHRGHTTPGTAKESPAPAGGNRAAGDGTTPTLNAAQQRILDALAWLKSIGNTIASVPQAALLAGMNHHGGYFNNTLGSLSTGGLVLRRNGTLELTPAGDLLAKVPDSPLSLEEFHRQIRTVLDKMKGGLTVRLFDAIVQFGNREVAVEDLASAVNASMDGGYFNNSLGPLGTLGLVERRKGVVHPTEILFPPQLT